MNQIETKLRNLKEQIDRAKENKAKAEGKLESRMEQLKKETGCSTVKEGRVYVEDLGKKVDKKKVFVEKTFKELEDEWEW